MTLQEAKTLHAYNAWANNRIFNTVEKLSPEQYKQDLKSSHGGIHGTLVHMVGAEKVWVERFNGSPQQFLKVDEIADAADLYKIWEKAGYETAKWLSTMNDKRLNDSFEMKTLKGEVFRHVFWQAFQHVINHSSYHRGAVITMLRQLGAEGVSTDLIAFYRETQRK
jgi:uncharacterized damage-inducible protein DinB